MPAKTARVFTSGNSQAVRLPREFRLETDEVFISRSGDSLILTPRMNSWEGFVEGFSGFSEDFAVQGDLSRDTARRTFE